MNRATKCVKLLLAAGIWTLVASPAVAACVGFGKDSFPCHFEILSWVSVSTDSEVISEEERTELERYLRLRARNDMSFLRHESVRLEEFFKKKPAPSEDEWKKRGEMRCHVWTVGKKKTVRSRCALTAF
jgi:hypothetical protein